MAKKKKKQKKATKPSVPRTKKHYIEGLSFSRCARKHPTEFAWLDNVLYCKACLEKVIDDDYNLSNQAHFRQAIINHESSGLLKVEESSNNFTKDLKKAVVINFDYDDNNWDVGIIHGFNTIEEAKIFVKELGSRIFRKEALIENKEVIKEEKPDPNLQRFQLE